MIKATVIVGHLIDHDDRLVITHFDTLQKIQNVRCTLILVGFYLKYCKVSTLTPFFCPSKQVTSINQAHI